MHLLVSIVCLSLPIVAVFFDFWLNVINVLYAQPSVVDILMLESQSAVGFHSRVFFCNFANWFLYKIGICVTHFEAILAGGVTGDFKTGMAFSR